MSRTEKTALFLSIALVVLMVFLILFSRHGYMDYRRLKAKKAGIIRQTLTVEGQNQQLEDQIRSLKHDPEYIRHVAKHEHHMAEPDEIIFRDGPESTADPGAPPDLRRKNATGPARTAKD